MHLGAEILVPSLSWLREYKPRFLKPDLLAGLTVAVMTIPQAMAYALIAGLPVQYGLYAAIVPTLLKNKDVVYAIIAVLEVIILGAAASGLLAVGH